ncbi:ankyrin repeat domain-containing protein [Rickettsia argasii]|uniref:Ankyrin repeat family protein n=1 Tax=Rickettsia argasii T170-B TaxID=1268837 RepID=A0A0F3RGC1_9RICK|nr:ankyrin repeat domain-containing protein [Rickettsia argasii]KJW04224.1 ankyrin repeat family protein [Rickettsia argasii T170-B]
MDKYYKIIENLVKFGVNPSLKANNILNLLATGTLQIQNTISKMSDNGNKYLAQAGFKTLIMNAKELVEKTLENCNLGNSTGGNNMIATLGNIIWSIKQDISNESGQEKTLLINNFKELKSLAEPIIEKIVKKQGFNPNIMDQLNSNTIAWFGAFGAAFLEKCIKNTHTKPDVNFYDKSGKTPLDWYSDYNATKIVETLIKNDGNVNLQCTQDAATPGHRLFLNNSKV